MGCSTQLLQVIVMIFSKKLTKFKQKNKSNERWISKFLFQGLLSKNEKQLENSYRFEKSTMAKILKKLNQFEKTSEE